MGVKYQQHGVILFINIFLAPLIISGSAAEKVISNPSHPFMNLETICNGDSLLIMASLDEPFYGVLYAMGYTNVAACRVEGTGNRLLRLAINASDCGIRFIPMEDGSRELDMSLYVQYDGHVQQAVDEQIQTRCRLTGAVAVATEEDPAAADSDHQHRNSVLFSAMEKIARRADAPLPHNIRPVTVKSSSTTVKPTPPSTKTLPITNFQATAKKIDTNREKVPIPAVISSGRLQIKSQEKVSCWMDIVPGSDPNNRPVDTFLRVGQEATLVVRVHQVAGLDTRLTSCWAHDGSHDRQQELLDADGCSVDATILPNVQERATSRQGIKLLFANFQAFKFPDRDHLHLKCTVVVCKGKCPMKPCNLIRRKGRDVRANNPVNPGHGAGLIGKGSSGVVRPLTLQEMAEANIRPASRSNSRASDREALRKQALNRSNNLTNIIQNLQNFGTIVDRVEVFNSIEVKMAFAPVEDSRVSKLVPRSPESQQLFDSSEAIFCLTPSTLFMAFGIVFAILISIMMCALCVCIRLKTKKQKVIPRSPRFTSTFSPPPRTPVPFPSTSISRNSTYMRHPNYDRPSTVSPYVRVFQ